MESLFHCNVQCAPSAKILRHSHNTIVYVAITAPLLLNAQGVLQDMCVRWCFCASLFVPMLCADECPCTQFDLCQ